MIAARGGRALLCIGGARYFEGVYFNTIDLVGPECGALYAGRRVQLTGLINCQELNGALGYAIAYIFEVDRWAVQLDSQGDSGDRVVSIKALNLIPA